MPCGEKRGRAPRCRWHLPTAAPSEGLNCGSRVMVSLPGVEQHERARTAARPALPIWLISSVRPSGSSSMSSGLLKLQVGSIPPAGTQPLTGGNFSPQPPSSASAISNEAGGAHGLISLPWLAPLWECAALRCRPVPAREQQAQADDDRRESRIDPSQRCRRGAHGRRRREAARRARGVAGRWVRMSAETLRLIVDGRTPQGRRARGGADRRHPGRQAHAPS